MNQILTGDCVAVMTDLSSNSVDLTVTSPPYDNLRTYNGFAWDLDGVASQLHRITKPGGVVVWVVGDAVIDGSESGSSFRQALRFIDAGFKLHDTMIYEKHNFSNPSSTRYHQIFEFMFVFTKGKPKTFNPIKDRLNVYAGKLGSWGKNTTRQVDGSFVERKQKVNTEFGMRHNIWRFKTESKPQHPAQFPLDLAKDHITSWSNPNDLVFDPFMGSGTTAIAAKLLGRNYLGCDISPEYVELATKRLQEIQ